MNRARSVLLFRVELRGIAPTIRRRIWVPATYSFWDLHVAIQDAMGWLDCHLHEFLVPTGGNGEITRFGIPDDEGFDDITELPGWEFSIADYCGGPGFVFSYIYDFGDDWEHEVTLEKVAPREKGVRYPQLHSGENACPPEDCGGPGGFMDMVQALRDITHPDHDMWSQWVPKGWASDKFDADAVRFSSPRSRWRLAFEQ